jgi:GST-like protein
MFQRNRSGQRDRCTGIDRSIPQQGRNAMYRLFCRAGWGSVLVEAQLALYSLEFTLEEVDDLFASTDARERLGAINPVAQLPTLVLPDGSVMTESAAITLHLAEVTGSALLVPPPSAPDRPRFLRWLVFLVANLYPCFTFADEPGRFVPEAAAAEFRSAVDRHAERLWRIVEREAGTPWFLGERFSALDLYTAVMTHWRPRRAWFAEHGPRLHAIALGTESRPDLAATWSRNFPAG